MFIEAIQDFISNEVRRQAARDPQKLNITQSDKPDHVRVAGELDLYELAKAIMREDRWLK
jgi:hypothetical protein